MSGCYRDVWDQHTRLLLDCMRRRMVERGEHTSVRMLYYLHPSRSDLLSELVAGTGAECLVEPGLIRGTLRLLAHEQVVAEIVASKFAVPEQPKAVQK